MDIFKILSRSTTQTNKASARKTGPSTNLPSAGTSKTPQLFYDEALAGRGKKRKRGEEQASWNPHDEDGAEDEVLDFFAPKRMTATMKMKKESYTDEKECNSNTLNALSQLPSKSLEEGECRQILKSHRVKVTVLPPAEKKIKKSKKAKVSKKTSNSKEYTQLYPQPLMAFDDLKSTYGISGRMAANLAQQGYKIPTEVQMGSLPLLLQPETALGDAAMELGLSGGKSNVNLLSVAPTGSGKTLAFLIPVINGIIQRRRRNQDSGGHSLDAVIVAPTKELASQIVNEAKKLSMGTGVKVVGMRRGMRFTEGADAAENLESSNDSEEEEGGEDHEKLKERSSQPIVKTDILITTPGLLLRMVSTGSGEEHNPLSTVSTLVLDEADVLLDPLFKDQTLGIWNACTNPDLRVTLWSATMGSSIETLTVSTIHSRRTRLELEDDTRIIRLVVGLKDSAIPNIAHRLTYAATEPGKLLALRQLLHPTSKTIDPTQSLRPPFLIFTQTIPRAVALHSELLYDIPAEAGGSSRISVLHSDLSDSTRDHIMSRFRNGEIWILITTDILSRGVDFRGVNGVVNYDVPNSGAAYIHRVGRTGRAGRDGGVAITFYTKEDIPYVKNIANIIAASEKQAGKPLSEASMQKWLLDALPTPSKEQKKNLKKYGVEARREGLGKSGKDKGKKGALISSKSGYERRLEHNRKGAIQGSRNRMLHAETEADPGEESEWGGIND